MKEKLKKMKGITLIALVITIVVLIILAGVIISITLGNGGIIDRAKTAKQEYANAQTKEETEIAEYSNKIEEYSAFTRAGGSIINYSTTPQDTGLKWIDGKNIYQKTIHCADITTAGGRSSNSLGFTFSTIISVNGYMKDQFNQLTPLAYSTGEGDTYYDIREVDGDWKLYIAAQSGNKYSEIYATIQYTK